MTSHSHSFEQAFSFLGKALDMFQALPSPGPLPKTNGVKTLSNGNGHGNGKAAPALPPAGKVRRATALATTAPEIKVRKKPGPKPKAAATAAPAEAAPKVSKKSTKKPATEASGTISAGRRAVLNGDRPKLTDAIGIILGKEQLKAGDILARLKENDWMPESSKPQNYISFTLSDNKELFERVGHGVYKVKDGRKFAKVAAEFGGKSSGKAERVASNNTTESEAEAPVSVRAEASTPVMASDPPTNASSEDTSDALEELGIGESTVLENPFEDS